jgi:RNA polymerase sigma-70 factor (ECF subfamily)
LFNEHRGSLVDYATGIVGSRAQAEDLVQEAFIRFAPVQATGSAVEQPLAYLYRIVRNLALDSTRRKALERRQREGEPAWWMVPAAPRTPEQELRHRQNLDRVEQALRELPKEMRLAVEMHRLGGYTTWPRRQLPEWTRFDIGARYVLDNLRSPTAGPIALCFNVDNVLDSTYWAGGGGATSLMLGAPRTFRLALTADF